MQMHELESQAYLPPQPHCLSSHREQMTEQQWCASRAAPQSRGDPLKCNTLSWVLSVITPGRMLKPEQFRKLQLYSLTALAWQCELFGLSRDHRFQYTLLLISPPDKPAQQQQSDQWHRSDTLRTTTDIVLNYKTAVKPHLHADP